MRYCYRLGLRKRRLKVLCVSGEGFDCRLFQNLSFQYFAEEASFVLDLSSKGGPGTDHIWAWRRRLSEGF
jgi:hypothetical protein